CSHTIRRTGVTSVDDRFIKKIGAEPEVKPVCFIQIIQASEPLLLGFPALEAVAIGTYFGLIKEGGILRIPAVKILPAAMKLQGMRIVLNTGGQIQIILPVTLLIRISTQ